MSQPGIAAKSAVGLRVTAASVKAVVLTLAYLALVGACYYLAARMALGFRFNHSQIGVVWPANAVVVSALLLTAKPRWWAVLLVAALAHIMAMADAVPGWRIAWQIVSNTGCGLAVAAVLQQVIKSPLDFGTRRQVVLFTIIVFLVPAVFSLTTPSFSRSLLGLEPAVRPIQTVFRVMFANGTAMLLVVPVVVLWSGYGLPRLRVVRPRTLRDAALIMLSLLGVGLVAFGSGPAIARLPATLLWVFPPLLWAAVRFGPLGASSALLCVAALSMGGTAWRLGPFVFPNEADHVLSLHIFWNVIGLPIMLLAAGIWERQQVEHALDEQRNQLAHITRVSTVGGLSGALAHELRQPLMAILANAQTGIHLLGSGSGDPSQMREILQDIVQQDKHAADIIRRLRTFLKETEPQFESLPVESVIGDALALSWSTVRLASVKVQTHIPPGLPSVRGDPVQLLQVVVNLVVNGCEAMVGVPEAERRLKLRAEASGHDHVKVSVADSGHGLPPGAAERVFEPFFTTKDTGLGLGLSIGRSIMAAHGGRLWGENNSHRGATFHLLLRTESANGVAPADRDRR